MNRQFLRERLHGASDRDSGATFDGLAFLRCEFDACLLSVSRMPEFRTTVRNCRLERCIARGNCAVYTPIIEDSVVDGLKTPGVLFLRGAVFKHVVLKGKIGPIVFGRPCVTNGGSEVAFQEANRVYYSTVDWALDLTQVEVQLELYLASVPGHLVRRDPATQILVKRERVMATDWRQIDLEDTAYEIMLDRLVREGRDSEVVVAPIGHRSLAMHLRVQQRLRDAGIAEPD